jgi:hypothetical protein
MNKGIFKVAISVTTSLLAQVAHVQPAAAQDVSDAGEANAANGEIIVTAQKRSERRSIEQQRDPEGVERWTAPRSRTSDQTLPHSWRK